MAVGEEEEEEAANDAPPMAVQGELKDKFHGVWTAVLTQTGYYPENPGHINQDRVTAESDWQGSGSFLLGVYDGHGPQGHEVAEFVSKELPASLGKTLLLLDPDVPVQGVAKALKSCYVGVDCAMNDSGIDSTFSGTTAVVAWIRPGGSLIVANTGDSRAVLGRINSKTREMEAVDLSVDQTPFRLDERARIEKSGGRISTAGELHGDATYASHEEYTADDPPRCYLSKQHFPGTAFTRSIGDQVAKSIGVIAKPEVKEYQLRKKDKFLILASDGVWEFISSQEAVDIVKDCQDPYEACHELTMAAWDIWLTEDVRSDDISVTVAFLDSDEMLASLDFN